MTELQTLIASARQQAAAVELAHAAEPQTTAERAKRLIELEAARQRRAWADFAERTGVPQ